jgi:flagellar biosynthetic protein FliO
LSVALAVCALGWLAAAAPPADPYSPEANSTPFEKKAVEKPAAAEAAAPAPEAKPAEAAPEQTPPPAAKAEVAPAETKPEAAPAEAPKQPESAPAAATKTPDWWGPIRDATGAEVDKAAAPAGSQPQKTAAEAIQPSGAKSVLKGIYALLVVLALIVGTYAVLLRLRRHAPMLAGGEFASVVGRLSLDSRFALHFVRVGDKVLLLGVTAQNINILEVFDAATFEQNRIAPDQPVEPQHDFLAHLRASTETLNPIASGSEDEELLSLRGDIERLKRYLEEGSRVDPKS